MLPADFTIVLTNLVQWLAVASLKTIPLVIFVLLVQRIFRKFLSASANYLLWLTVLISLCIPFGWQLKVAPVIPTTHLAQSVMSNAAEVDANNKTPLKREKIASQNTESFSSAQPHSFSKHTDNNSITSLSNINGRFIFALFWLIGATAFLFLIVTRAYQFHRIKINAEKASGEIFEMLQICKLEMRVNKPIQLLSTNAIQSPVTLGWIKPAIMLPKELEHQLAPAKLKHILLHEIGHIKRQDIFFNWITCIVNILHWFNPIVWFACRYMRRDMEMACDALVLSHLDKTQRKNYGATLIEISEIPRFSPRVFTTLGMFENHTELKQRLTMIKDFTVMNIKNTLIFGLLLLTTAFTALAQPELQKTQSLAAEATSVKTASGTSLRDVAIRAEKDLNKKVLVGQKDADKNVQVNFGSDKIDYGQLLTQLKINAYTAYKSKDYIQIISIDEARFLAVPTVEKGKNYYEDEIVTDYIKTEKACSGQVLATIRPLIPQYAHLSLYEGARSLVIVDTFGNIQRIKSVVKALEDNIDTPVDCKNIAPPEFRPNPAKAEKK